LGSLASKQSLRADDNNKHKRARSAAPVSGVRVRDFAFLNILYLGCQSQQKIYRPFLQQFVTEIKERNMKVN